MDLLQAVVFVLIASFAVAYLLFAIRGLGHTCKGDCADKRFHHAARRQS